MESQDSTSEIRNTTASYPEGPISCCLWCISKDVRVSSDRTWSLSLAICCVTIVLSITIYLVAFGTTGWVRVSKPGELPPRLDRVGLWQECIDDRCSYIASDITGAGFKTSQTLAVLCLVLLASSLLSTFKYCFSVPPHTETIGKITMCLRFVSFSLLFILIPVFAMTWDKDHARYSQPVYDGRLAYSFVLLTVTFVLEAIGAFFTYCQVVVLQRRQVLIRKPATDTSYDGIANEGFVDITGDTGVFPGDVSLSSPDGAVDSFSDHVVGRMNAQASYENNARRHHNQMELYGVGVAGPLCSSGLIPTSSCDQITKRYVELIKAEPEYVNQPRPDPEIDNFGPDPEEPLYEEIALNISSMKQSVSMQNVFSDDLSRVTHTVDGRLVTSVSMYNISADLPEIIYDRDTSASRQNEEQSLSSWRPEMGSFEEPAEDHHESLSTNHAGEADTRKSRKKRAPVERRADGRHRDYKSVSATMQPTDNTQDKSQNTNQARPQFKQKKKKTGKHSIDRVLEACLEEGNTQITQTENCVNKNKPRTVGNQNLGSMSHGQSVTSLHSLASLGSTSIVGGCAETEI